MAQLWIFIQRFFTLGDEIVSRRADLARSAGNLEEFVAISETNEVMFSVRNTPPGSNRTELLVAGSLGLMEATSNVKCAAAVSED
jgi:hypothetical protein